MSSLDDEEATALLSNPETEDVLKEKYSTFPKRNSPETEYSLRLLGAGQPYTPPYSTQMAESHNTSENEQE